MRERCLNIIAALPLPRPFELEEFRLALSRWRRRGLYLVPAPGARDGLWIAAGAADYIYYPVDAAPLRQLQVIATELGHMLLEHEGTPTATSQIARLLLPSLDPALTVATLGRFRHSPAQHREAAAFAALLLDHMETAIPTTASLVPRSRPEAAAAHLQACGSRLLGHLDRAACDAIGTDAAHETSVTSSPSTTRRLRAAGSAGGQKVAGFSTRCANSSR